VSFWRTALQFRKEKIAPWIALRNTLGFALVLAGGFALGFVPAALIASIGALNVSYSDSHDPYLLRARRMLAACALVGLAVFAGAVSGNYHLLAVPVAGAWAFAAGMLVALSSTAADLGIMSLVTLVVFAAKPLPPESAVLSGLLALGGGLLETALALAFWPMRKYAPNAASWLPSIQNWPAPPPRRWMCASLLRPARRAPRRRRLWPPWELIIR
jgi:hypothetical protein